MNDCTVNRINNTNPFRRFGFLLLIVSYSKVATLCNR